MPPDHGDNLLNLSPMRFTSIANATASHFRPVRKAKLQKNLDRALSGSYHFTNNLEKGLGVCG
jgi:hypothetical protein